MSRSKSFLRKLLVGNAVVLAVAFAAATWLTIQAGRQALDTLVTDGLGLRARLALREVDRYLADRGQEIRSWSGLSVMDEILLEDRSLRIENLLLELQREHAGSYSVLTVLDRDQTVVASSDVSAVGDRLPLEELRLRRVSGGRLRVGRPQPPDPATSGLVLVHPVISRLDPEPIGWLLGRVEWSAVDVLVSPAELGGGSREAHHALVLVDREGNVLAGRSPLLGRIPDVGGLARSAKPGQVVTEETGSAGSLLVACHESTSEASVLDPGTRIVGLWGAEEAYALERIFIGSVLGSALLGLVLAVSVSTLIARGVTRRVRTLTEGTRRLAEEDLSFRVPEGPDDELGGLARSFNAMASSLAAARESVEAALARWRALVSHAPDVILTVDREGTIGFLNRAAPGFVPQDALGSCLYSLVLPEYREVLRRSVEEVFRARQARSLEIAGPGSSESRSSYSLRLGPILRDAAVEGVTIIVTDITERRKLEDEIVGVDELERARIGQELHDSLGQLLTAISLLSKGLERKLADPSPGEAGTARQILGLSNDAIRLARDLARGLFPIALDTGGLEDALSELAASTQDIAGVPCHVDVAPRQIVHDRTKARHLFRIAQEAVRNSVRHAEPSTITIRLAAGDPNLLSVEDDGVGIRETSPETQGMGLRLMKYRAELIGASLRIGSRPQGGTIVSCSFR